MLVYIAGPLFSDGERAFNEQVDAIVRSCGHDTYLPQRDGGRVTDLPDTIDGVDKHTYLFRLDCENLRHCDVFLYLMDGRVPDEGASFALGFFTPFIPAVILPSVGEKRVRILSLSL